MLKLLKAQFLSLALSLVCATLTCDISSPDMLLATASNSLVTAFMKQTEQDREVPGGLGELGSIYQELVDL